MLSGCARWWLLNAVSLFTGLACVFVVYSVSAKMRVCGVPVPIYVVEDDRFAGGPFGIVAVPVDFVFGLLAPRVLLRLLRRMRSKK